MNTRPPIESSSYPTVLSAAFNDDASCFSIGLDRGFAIFHAKTCLLKTRRDFGAGMGLVQMMGKTNMLALAGGGRRPKFATNKVVIWNDSACGIAFEITTLKPVRGVRLSKDGVVIVLQDSVRVYRFCRTPDLVVKYDTADNHLGLCALTQGKLAFPGRTAGQVQLVDNTTGNVSIIPAHSSALRAIQLSPDGELLATASESGTIIRVFATCNCARVVELRRGIDSATIYSLGFSPSGTMLACTSDKATLHIFDVPHPGRPQRQASPKPAQNGSSVLGGADNGDGKGKWGILAKIPLLPRVFSDVYSFASAPFEVDDEVVASGPAMPASGNSDTLGTSRPQKGLIGWIAEDSLLVIGAGRDARWEMFVITENEGRRYCTREGWKRYMGQY